MIEAQAGVAAAEDALRPLRAQARDLELEVSGVAEKADATNTLLYSGEVSNPKELEGLQAEVEALNKRKAGLEETMIGALAEAEAGQRALAAAQATLKAATEANTETQKTLRAEFATLKAEAQGLDEMFKAAAKQIEPAAFQKYEALRATKQGQPVALLREESCGRCGVEQTTVIIHKVRQGRELTFCLSCGRILA
jgi:hypothetical protein